MAIDRSCLFVSDDRRDQACFIEALSTVSPRTLCFAVSDAIDALCMMCQEHIRPDFIFVEIKMSGLDGLGFLKEIKRIDDFKGIPVIVHAPSPLPSSVIELMEAGAAAIYLREYNLNDTCSMLNLLFTAVISNAAVN